MSYAGSEDNGGKGHGAGGRWVCIMIWKSCADLYFIGNTVAWSQSLKRLNQGDFITIIL